MDAETLSTADPCCSGTPSSLDGRKDGNRVESTDERVSPASPANTTLERPTEGAGGLLSPSLSLRYIGQALAGGTESERDAGESFARLLLAVHLGAIQPWARLASLGVRLTSRFVSH